MLAILFIALAIVGLVFIGIIVFVIAKSNKETDEKKTIETIEREKLLKTAREKKAATNDIETAPVEVIEPTTDESRNLSGFFSQES